MAYGISHLPFFLLPSYAFSFLFYGSSLVCYAAFEPRRIVGMARSELYSLNDYSFIVKIGYYIMLLVIILILPFSLQ